MKDVLRYDRMVEQALRGVVREALAIAATKGLPGEHHFFITFQTRAPDVALPDYLLSKYPQEITIVLQHEFWELEVREDAFSVTLKFHGKHERLTIPFAAITAFADPSIKFLLQFQTAGQGGPPNGDKPHHRGAGEPASALKPENKTGEVVALDSFRKK